MRTRALGLLRLALALAPLLGCDGSSVVDASHQARLLGASSIKLASARGTGTTSFATLITLPALSGSPSEALAVNRAGTVITGYGLERRGTMRAVRWTLQANGSWAIEALPLSPSATGGNARGVNDAGDAAGNDFPGSTPHVVLWPSTGGFAFPGCDEFGEGYAISATSQIVVGVQHVVQPTTAEIWRPGACREDLPSLAPGGWAAANAVNGDGTIVGGAGAETPSGAALPLRWSLTNQAWRIEQLDQRSGAALNANAAGDLAGYVVVACEDPAGCDRALVWYASGASRELGTLGGPVSFAKGINGSGEIVGSSSPSAQASATGFFWSAASGMVQLPSSGRWAAANGVSDIRADGTRLVVGMNSRAQPIAWIVRSP
jgi:uncharacterized membrane protein